MAGLLVIFRRREQCIRRKYLSVSVKTAKRQRLNKSKRQRIEISQPDESYSNLLNQSQDRALEPDASYSALETVAVYSGLQNQTQATVL
ncbi:pleiotropic drug resistance protein 4 [Dorcoceras hygrometricum]|uniref:Pleiotropic drug resistance protein 4 n=1 Tax=Dorcoceras hygrometricum TaxID=472368 RepID=A0A2Z7AZS3_9LAMI|nr:pleiotropic drug resistance protein 4 [Dorcoceras hygrometricum]